MPSNDDLSDLLSQWPYDHDDYLREIVGADGRKKLQVRFPMGVEQYELDGRPDGKQPMGFETMLDYYLHLRREATAAGGPGTFHLTSADCEELRDEAMIFSYRYDLMYQRKDYERVVRDTAHNLLVFDLVTECAELVEDAESMEIYRPFALRLHYASRALVSLRRRRHEEALRLVRLGLQRLEQLDESDDPKWHRERKMALVKLRRLGRRIRRAKPLSQRERLQLELKQAVDREDYEGAARIRDRIAALPHDEPADESPSA